MTTKPVTTAAYQVKEMIAGSTSTLEKNKDYWQTDDSKISSVSTTNVDTIVYKVVTEASQMATAIQTGDIDVAQYMDTTAIDPFYANGKATNGYQVEQLNSNMMFTVLPNMSKDSILSTSKELREAIYYAINAEDCLKASCGGYGETLSAMANPLSGDYVESWKDRDYYNYNIETAKQKLKDSGVDVSGKTLKILTQPAFNLDKVAEVIQAALQEIGINSKIVNVEDALYQTYKTDSKQFDLILDIKGTDDYCTFPWSLLFDNRSFDGQTANFIKDDKLQELMEKSLSTDTHNEDSVNEFETYLDENAYAYGLFTRANYIVAKSGKVSKFAYFSGTYILPGSCEY